jgi:hypothetical protein
MLVSDIIFSAFLDMGAVAPGETLTAAESADAFARLNMMLSSWATEQLTAPSMTHTGFVLTAGTNLYTLGTAGALVTASRPIRVVGAQSVSGNFRMGMKVMSFDQFAQEVSDPIASASALAEVLAADGSFPNINLRVHPMPAAAPGTLWLDYWMAIAQFVTVGDTVNMPDGWPDALHFNLAVRLYPQYARAGGMDPVLAANAQTSKGALNDLNAKILGQQQAPAPPQQGGQ